MKRLILILASACAVTFLFAACLAEAKAPKYKTAEGLVMAGYQGWFNAEGDGANLRWKHYEKGKEFYPGNCTIDLWPDVSEYKVTYESPFKMADGKPARLFSSRDASTTDLHFKWMKEYGIDGVYMQRFVTTLRGKNSKDNYNIILGNAMKSAEKYGRAICVMYDLSGIKPEEVQLLLDDWKDLSQNRKVTENSCYLHHKGKPLVAVWGVGFNDNRKYGYDDIEKIISFFEEQGCSILLGVPTYWRSLSMDTMPDPRLHEIIRRVDIVHPWFVGRFNKDSYDRFAGRIADDIAWCNENGLDYMPVLFPGFSWYNLQGGVAAPLNQIPRLGGEFFWKQVNGALSKGAKMLYLAMFDEIDEGTAFFKCANEVPVGESPFLSYEGVESDRYLWLAGMAAKSLRGEIELTEEMPQR